MNDTIKYLELTLTPDLIKTLIVLATLIYSGAFYVYRNDSGIERFKKSSLISFFVLLVPLTIFFESILMDVLNSIGLPELPRLEQIWRIKTLTIFYFINPITLEILWRVLKYLQNFRANFDCKYKESIRAFREKHETVIITTQLIIAATCIFTLCIHDYSFTERLQYLKFITIGILVLKFTLEGLLFLNNLEDEAKIKERKWNLKVGDDITYLQRADQTEYIKITGQVTDLCNDASFIKVDGDIVFRKDIL